MCDVQSAIAVVGAVQGYREKKAQNKAISRDQETSRRHADKGYLHDLNKIDQEKINADMEKTKSEISIKAEREKEIAQKTNLGFGNGVKIVQSMGQLYDEDWLEVTSLYDKDMQLFANQKTEAFANMSKTYNSLTPPLEPSRTGLLLDVASSAYGGYQRNETNKKPKKGG
jgi:hypothetical protein